MVLTSQYQFIKASNKLLSVNGNNGYQLLLYAKTVQNQSTGEQSVSVKLVLAALNSGTFYKYSSTASAKVGSTTAFTASGKPSAAWDMGSFYAGGVLYKNGSVIGSGTVVVSGAGSITLSGSWKFTAQTTAYYTPRTNAEATISVSVDLPTISSATEPVLSKYDFTYGEEIKISLSNSNPNCTHNLSYEFEGQTGVIANGVKGSYTWGANQTAALSQYATRKVSSEGYVVCTTMLNGTTIGTKRASFKITADAKIAPQAEMSISAGGVKEFEDVYLQNCSYLVVNFSETMYKYGTSALSFSVDIKKDGKDWKKYSSSYSPLHVPLTESGKFTVIGCVEDYREQYDYTEPKEIEVLPYKKPCISSARCRRFDEESGAYVTSGTSAHLYAITDVSSILVNGEERNGHVLLYRYCRGSDFNYYEWTPIDEYGSVGEEIHDQVLNDYFENTETYFLQVRVVDYAGNEDVVEFVLPSLQCMMFFGGNGKSIGIGQYASDQPNRVDFGWKAYFNAGIGEQVFYDNSSSGIDRWGTIAESTQVEKMSNLTIFTAQLKNGTNYLMFRVGDTIESIQVDENGDAQLVFLKGETGSNGELRWYVYKNHQRDQIDDSNPDYMNYLVTKIVGVI